MSDENQSPEGTSYAVVDKRLEQGLSLNNILSFTLIGVMSWVGLNIENIKEELSEANAMNRVQTVRITTLEKRVDKVEKDMDGQKRQYWENYRSPQNGEGQ